MSFEKPAEMDIDYAGNLATRGIYDLEELLPGNEEYMAKEIRSYMDLKFRLDRIVVKLATRLASAYAEKPVDIRRFMEGMRP